MRTRKNPYRGTNLDDFLKEEFKNPRIKKGAEEMRLKLAVGRMVRRIAKQQRLSFRALAKRMGGSISQIQRLMSDENVNLDTLTKFAVATGKKLHIELK